MKHKFNLAVSGAFALSMALSPMATAAPNPLTGAIFTTDASGVPVNLNIYQAKEDVYLNGGPGINAPADAAGLPDGTYSFQVTDPPGKTLLSTDPVRCRQFTVVGGVIQGVVVQADGCQHAQGADGEDGGATVQLFPYLDTPNNGGVYKVWVTRTSDLKCGKGSRFCFVPSASKTDNFKVRNNLIVEIDTRFYRGGVGPIDGLRADWTDTNGATNTKYSEYNPAVLAYHEAHVEAAEQGTHTITVKNQPGCTVKSALTPTGSTVLAKNGVLNVSVTVADHTEGDHTYWVDVQCG